jgi:predicted nucleotidyltransferase
MGVEEMVTRQAGSTSFWQKLRRGLWPESVAERIEAALDTIVRRLRCDEAVAGIVVFGSYARGDFGRSSDLDLLVVLRQIADVVRQEAERRVTSVIGEAETALRLPVHLAPLIVASENPEELDPAILHEIWTDGIILYSELARLAVLQPRGLAPWNVIRFSLDNVVPRDRVKLARRLHGTSDRPGIIRLPGLNLARGAAFVPAQQARAIRDILDEVGATYDLLPVWRDV